jgi:RecJ-like exonuclease
MKRIYLLMMVAFVFACGTWEKPETTEAVEVGVKTLADQAEEYVGKTVELTGTVVHVCRHGGKRLFMIGDEPQPRFKVTAGPEVGSFDLELEGSKVKVTGVVNVDRVDEAFLDRREAELETGTKEEVEHQAHREEVGEAEMSEAEETKEQLKAMRKQLEESCEEQLSFYSVEANSLEKR